MMNVNARIDEQSWLRCGKCSHKLGKLEKSDNVNVRIGSDTNIRIEIKCHSCKAINIIDFTSLTKK